MRRINKKSLVNRLPVRIRNKKARRKVIPVIFFWTGLIIVTLLAKEIWVGQEITESSNNIQKFLLSATIERLDPLELEVRALTFERDATQDEIQALNNTLEILKRSDDNKIEEIKSLGEYIGKLESGQVSTNVDHILSGKITEAIEKASATYGVDKALIRAVIKQESNFNINVTSHAGAQGLMQLMPETARILKVNNVWDIEDNIMGGTLYLRDQLNDFKDMKLALAAYNAGPNNVRKYKGIPPFRETQGYVVKVIKNYNAFK
jgi:hypothetical protein